MSFACKVFGHKWEHCRCQRCGAVREEDHQWDGCICRICWKKRDEEHDWNGCKCRKCGMVRNKNHLWNGCTCSVCGKTRNEGHDWNGCKCRICGKVREEGHQPDMEKLLKQARWVYHGAAIQPWEATAVLCRNCGKPMVELKRDHTYCPKCFREMERKYVPSDEPTLLKYRFACQNCGYDKTVCISDGY